MVVVRWIYILTALSLANSTRISVRLQLDVSARSPTRVGPEGESWVENTKYVCIQKWQTGGFKAARYVNSYCLVDYKKALSIAAEHFQAAKDLAECESTKATHTMRTCALKGESPDGRLSWNTRAYVPKTCFRFSSIEGAFPVIEAALNEDTCKAAMTRPEDDQGIIRAKRTTTTTTTTTTTITSTTTDIENEIDAIAAESGDEVSGTIDAVALFLSGSEKLWDYDGKSIKCCTSSAGKPTQLQDMKAEQLPAARSLGKRTGCGYMFGDTYHNGPKRHGACPVLASAEEFEAIKSSLADLSSSFGLARVSDRVGGFSSTMS